MKPNKDAISSRFFYSNWFFAFTLSIFSIGLQQKSTGQSAIEMEFLDEESGAPVSARLTFTKSGKRLSRPKKMLFAGEQWLGEQKLALSPPVGEYEFLVQRGPEFKEIRGGFTIEPKAKDSVVVEIPRAVDMHAEHWFSGDHLSSLPAKQLTRWQQADAVDIAVSTEAPSLSATPTKPPSNSKRRDKDRSSDDSQEDNTDVIGLQLTTQSQWLDWSKGAAIIHGIETKSSDTEVKPSSAPESGVKTPSTIPVADALSKIQSAKEKDGALIELVRPWTRDVPILLGSQSIDAVQLLSTYNRPTGDDRIALSKASKTILQGNIQIQRGKERILSELFAPIETDEELKFNSPRGVGRLSEFIYWKMLEAGLRIPPTAGSDFSNNDTHVGYNRVYVHSQQTPTVDSWWQSIAQGKTMVSNGPLLRVSINGQQPGSVQASYRGQSIPLDIAASLAVREEVDYLDVVFNGETIYSAKLEDHYQRGEFPPLEISESGWVVVRVITGFNKGYRYATTAPFYFEFDGKPRVARDAVTFFQNWLNNAADEIGQSDDQESYKSLIQQSQNFWQEKLDASN